MPLIPFNKPATTYTEQVALLRSRGMIIDDEQSAQSYLKHLNYYRLGAYWLPYEASHADHKFKPGTRFTDVVSLYKFDRELRLLLMDAIERIEVSVRAQWSYHMANNHGPHSHLDKKFSKKEHRWEKNVEELKECVGRCSKETFISHITKKYSEELPPIWAVCEVMTLGLLSKWYEELSIGRTRRAISSAYSLDEATLSSWLNHISSIRNVCAHHMRLWNRSFVVTPQNPISKPLILAGKFRRESRKLYNALLILLYLMDIIAPGHQFRTKLVALLEQNGAHLAQMDFPDDWKTHAIWRGMETS